MAAETDNVQVLNILCQKHSNLSQYKTTQDDEAKKLLEENKDITKYCKEIEYIKNQLITKVNSKDGDNKENENDSSLKIVFHVTGFGKFGKIVDNPTTHLIKNLPKYVRNLPSNVSIPTMKVLHVSGENSLKELKEIRQTNDKNAENTVYVYLHFGVAAGREVMI